MSFNKISQAIGKDNTTVSKEIKKNIIFVNRLMYAMAVRKGISVALRKNFIGLRKLKKDIEKLYQKREADLT